MLNLQKRCSFWSFPTLSNIRANFWHLFDVSPLIRFSNRSVVFMNSQSSSALTSILCAIRFRMFRKTLRSCWTRCQDVTDTDDGHRSEKSLSRSSFKSSLFLNVLTLVWWALENLCLWLSCLPSVVFLARLLRLFFMHLNPCSSRIVLTSCRWRWTVGGIPSSDDHSEDAHLSLFVQVVVKRLYLVVAAFSRLSSCRISYITGQRWNRTHT